MKRAKPEDQKSFNLKDGKSTPAKLPKSKVDIYDSQKNFKSTELLTSTDTNTDNKNHNVGK